MSAPESSLRFQYQKIVIFAPQQVYCGLTTIINPCLIVTPVDIVASQLSKSFPRGAFSHAVKMASNEYQGNPEQTSRYYYNGSNTSQPLVLGNSQRASPRSDDWSTTAQKGPGSQTSGYGEGGRGSEGGGPAPEETRPTESHRYSGSSFLGIGAQFK